MMSALRIAMMAAALTTVAVVPCVTASIASASPSYTYICRDVGYGSTAAAAEDAAISQLYGDYPIVYQPIILVSDTEGSNGTWYAEVSADCSGMPR